MTVSVAAWQELGLIAVPLLLGGALTLEFFAAFLTR